MSRTSAAFAELVAASNYSFLRGASHPADLVKEAVRLGLSGLGIADQNSVAGVVRAWAALRQMREQLGEDMPPFTLVVGARLVFADGTPDIIAYPLNCHGWGRLTRLLTLGNLRAKKGDCILNFADLADYHEGLALIAMGGDAEFLSQLRALCPKRLWLAATMNRSGADDRRLAERIALSRATRVPLIATNDALYAAPESRPLHDIVTCIREGTSLEKAGRMLLANAERHLKPPTEMARLFRAYPKAVSESLHLLSRINFRLEDLRYEYPHESVPDGWQPLSYLYHLVKQAALQRYGAPLPDEVRRLIAEEIWLIRRQKYAHYFLTVYDLVRFARAQNPPILCQGRGSAANSIVCFLLGVTSVDPIEHSLLFSRFISAERNEPPDIDIDFEHERREEVIQYIYGRYGRHRAAIAATVIHYRPRSTVREVGKVLGFSEDVTARLADTSWGSKGSDIPEERLNEAGLDLSNPDVVRFYRFVGELLTFPRHLSQHVGGFILTEGRLDELVPIHHGAMEGRNFIEWDKDDIDALGLMKVDVLALGMLTCIRKSFELMRAHDLGEITLEVDLKADDPKVYAMLQRGDSIGVFQVESRAQINMLPRLKPRKFYDLVVQVAIVRPGPIEGDMVHPYLRRRSKREAVVFPSPAPPHPADELKILLGKTYGVPLFQEQAMKLSIVAAGFTPEEANGLRRAMATFRHLGIIDNFRDKLIHGMTRRGYDRDFAERCFRQIEGFGSYGFPESHAQSFARLVYVSAWLKCHHPAIFTCALLNSQPMGFYAPAQLVRDARDHGVEVRAIDVNHSHWDCTMERRDDGTLALRLGFRIITGFRQNWAEDLVAARGQGFVHMEDLARRAHLPSQALNLLAEADAFASLGLDRRPALWDARRMSQGVLPLFEAADAQQLGHESPAALPVMPEAEEVITDYQTTRLSLRGHPLEYLRQAFEEEGILTCDGANKARNGHIIRTAGVVLIRQRPGKGNAIFITLEDESGTANLLMWARDFARNRRVVMTARLMMVRGEVQRSPEGVVHIMVRQLWDATPLLDRLITHSDDKKSINNQRLMLRNIEKKMLQPEGTNIAANAAQHGHPRNAKILPKIRTLPQSSTLPKSRDFH